MNQLSALHMRFKIAVNRVEAAVFDYRHGTDTRGKAAVADLDNVVGENVGGGTGYQAVNESHFRHVMRSLRFPHGSVFVDIGCGKGKPLLLAAEYPYIDKAIGVEFAGGLCEAARRNAEIYGAKRNITRKIEVLHQDALTYVIEPEQNIFFLNNPFDARLLSVFADKIAESIREHPRDVWLLYGNPAHADVIDSHPDFRREAFFAFYGPGRNIAVYRNRKPSA